MHKITKRGQQGGQSAAMDGGGQGSPQTPAKRPLRLVKKGTRRKKQENPPLYSGAALKRLENAI